MALVPKLEPKQDKKAVSVRLDEPTHMTLQRYAEFLGDASHEYVIGESLKRLFRRDKEFRGWLEKHYPDSAATLASNPVAKNATKPVSSAA
jgi:hypothetical protein